MVSFKGIPGFIPNTRHLSLLSTSKLMWQSKHSRAVCRHWGRFHSYICPLRRLFDSFSEARRQATFHCKGFRQKSFAPVTGVTAPGLPLQGLSPYRTNDLQVRRQMTASPAGRMTSCACGSLILRNPGGIGCFSFTRSLPSSKGEPGVSMTVTKWGHYPKLKGHEPIFSESWRV